MERILIVNDRIILISNTPQAKCDQLSVYFLVEIVVVKGSYYLCPSTQIITHESDILKALEWSKSIFYR